MMKQTRWLQGLMVLFTLGVVSFSYAGSERLIMVMSMQRMEQENLVFVRLLGPNDEALESDVLKQIVISEQDCTSGRTIEMIRDYKIGYAPKSMMVGLYLFPQAWSNKALCFSAPNLERLEQSFNPQTNKGRIFQLKFTQPRVH